MDNQNHKIKINKTQKKKYKLEECPICGSRQHTDGRCEALANQERFN